MCHSIPVKSVENEKILDILGETCKSEPVKEEGSELEQPFAQDTSSVGPDRKLAEEEDLFGSGHPEEGDLDLASESTAQAQWSKADTLLAVVKREPVEQTGGDERTDCEPVGLEEPVEQSSKASERAEASSEEVAEAPREASSPDPRDSKEDVKKFAFEACNEVPPAPKESSASEGADQKMSSVEDDSDTKKLSKEDKGRSAWRHQPFAVCVASAVAGYLILVYRVLHFSPRFACESFMEPFSPLFCFSLGRCWDLGSKPVPQGWCVDVVQAPAFARAL